MRTALPLPALLLALLACDACQSTEDADGAPVELRVNAPDASILDHDFRGHAFEVNHQFNRKIGLQLLALTSPPLSAAPPDDVTAYRVRLDLNVKL